MIVFDLACHRGHRFEGWFSSAGDFSSQQERKLVSCPNCDSGRIERIPSATRINLGGTAGDPERGSPAPAPSGAPSPATGMEGRDPAAVAQMLFSRMVDEILTRTEDLGREFPAEARRMHYGETAARPIRGIATNEEHDALADEGIPVARLPLPPSGSWN